MPDGFSDRVWRPDPEGVAPTLVEQVGRSLSKHVGELGVLVGPQWRGRGLGRVLIQECFARALERGLKKLVSQMTVDQHGAIAVFEQIGFRAEALLARHVADPGGKLHDLVLLSHDVAAVEARNDALGLTEALGG